jgi:hypothetical protein
MVMTIQQVQDTLLALQRGQVTLAEARRVVGAWLRS